MKFNEDNPENNKPVVLSVYESPNTALTKKMSQASLEDTEERNTTATEPLKTIAL